MRNKKIMVFTVIGNIFWVLMCFPAFYLLAFSAMLFDAPGSESSCFTLMLFYSILSFIPVVLISIIGAWVCYALKKNRLTVIITHLPLLNIICGFLAIALITFVCEGSLVCH